VCPDFLIQPIQEVFTYVLLGDGRLSGSGTLSTSEKVVPPDDAALDKGADQLYLAAMSLFLHWQRKLPGRH